MGSSCTQNATGMAARSADTSSSWGKAGGDTPSASHSCRGTRIEQDWTGVRHPCIRLLYFVRCEATGVAVRSADTD
jgi:hypothetical protein